MKESGSIQNNLFRNLILLSFIPFIVVVIIFAFVMSHNSIEESRADGMYKNQVMNEKLEDVLNLHFTILRNFGVNPETRQYILQDESDRDGTVKLMLDITNGGFKDSGTMSIANADGLQIARTDNKAVLDISDLQYFIKTMDEQREVVSDVLIDEVTGKLTVYLTVPIVEMSEDNLIKYKNSIISINSRPVEDESGQEKYIIGMVQREYGLDFFQGFAKSISEEGTEVLILDNQGRLIVNSDMEAIETEEDRIDKNNIREQAICNYSVWKSYVEDDTEGELSIIPHEAGIEVEGAEPEEGYGSMDMEINGKECLVCFSVNSMTGWMVATVRPYSDIRLPVIKQVLVIGFVGSIALIIIAFTASYVSRRSTKDITEEISALSDARDKFKNDSETDILTGLYNKAALERMAVENLSESENDSLNVIYMVDLDHFKEINDTFGHQAGDELLKSFAKKLKKNFRIYDIVARFGGDEFVVVLTDMPNMEVVILKANQIGKIALSLKHGEENAGVSASIGIATTTGHELNYEELFQKADSSVYRVKNDGRNGYSHNEGDVVHFS